MESLPRPAAGLSGANVRGLCPQFERDIFNMSFPPTRLVCRIDEGVNVLRRHHSNRTRLMLWVSVCISGTRAHLTWKIRTCARDNGADTLRAFLMSTSQSAYNCVLSVHYLCELIDILD